MGRRENVGAIKHQKSNKHYLRPLQPIECLTGDPSFTSSYVKAMPKDRHADENQKTTFSASLPSCHFVRQAPAWVILKVHYTAQVQSPGFRQGGVAYVQARPTTCYAVLRNSYVHIHTDPPCSCPCPVYSSDPCYPSSHFSALPALRPVSIRTGTCKYLQGLCTNRSSEWQVGAKESCTAKPYKEAQPSGGAQRSTSPASLRIRRTPHIVLADSRRLSLAGLTSHSCA